MSDGERDGSAAMLQQVGDELWTSTGPSVSVAGFDYPTRVAVIRLFDGGLFIWSPTALSAELRLAVDLLGPVRHIVAPNTLHHRFVGEWQAAYPAATTHAAPGLQRRRPDLDLDEELGDGSAPAWTADIDQVMFRGNRITTEVVFFHRRSRTMIVADLVQHFRRDWFTGWRGLVAHLDLLTDREPTVPRKFRMAFSDRKAAREALKQVMRWPAEKALLAHGPLIEENGRAVIAQAFAWLSTPVTND